MTYEVILLRTAQRALATMPRRDYERVMTAIEGLTHTPLPAGCQKLTNSPYWQVRVGDYRVVYEIDHAGRVVVTTVGHRRDVYR